MREMHWSWRELNGTPPYVQNYCWDFLQRLFEEESNRMKDAQKRNQ